MVNYYLEMEPHLFKEAVNTQFERIKEEREEAAAAAKERQKNAPPASSDKSEMVLYRCPHFLPDHLLLCASECDDLIPEPNHIACCV